MDDLKNYVDHEFPDVDIDADGNPWPVKQGTRIVTQTELEEEKREAFSSARMLVSGAGCAMFVLLVLWLTYRIFA